jgi:hypothetical protein
LFERAALIVGGGVYRHWLILDVIEESKGEPGCLIHI